MHTLPPNTSAATAPTRFARFERACERLLFSHRALWLGLMAVLSVLLAWQALRLQPDASFEKMVPAKHPFVVNYLRYENELRPLGNTIRIAVEVTEGDIYTRDYLELIRRITDEVFYIPGIDRGNLRSLWTPNTMWFETTEDGMRAGKVIPADFGSLGLSRDVAVVRENVAKSGVVGSLVANDHRSSVIYVPLLETHPETGMKLDYGQFSQMLEDRIRGQYERAGVRIHIIGFAKLVGDLIHGARAIGQFFLLTVALTSVLILLYSRCWRSTAATVFCCLLAVVWHLGVMRTLGFGLDPYSILVPFLTFAIGVSHAVQNINTFAAETRAGADKLEASRRTFRWLFVPGTVALLCDVVGFSTLLLIDIGVIRELAISASVGVAMIIFTKMFLLPLLMSWLGLSPAGLRLAQRRHQGRHRLAAATASLTRPRNAVIAAALAAVLAGWGFVEGRKLQIGDLDAGASELRPQSRYNLDTAFFSAHYATSNDIFVVMVATDPSECGSYEVASTVSRLQWALEDVPGVQSTQSLFDWMKKIIVSNYGGNPKWATVTRNRYVSNAAHKAVPQAFYNAECSMLPVIVYLQNHKAATLDAVVDAVQRFNSEHAGSHAQLLLAAGNSGIEAATNAVVQRAWLPMLGLVYAIVALLLLIEFRSLRVTLCLVIPLVITSLLCEAVMALLGLGVKVATLPVIALGVGIGVDYGIYLYNRLDHHLAEGLSLRDACFQTMKTTGLAVAFTGITLAAGVVTWIFSDIKFQADMGVLLTFMFLWNMVGAVILIPVLAALLGVGRPAKGQVEGVAAH